MNEPVVKKAMFDEAVRSGIRGAEIARQNMRISRTAVDAITDALELMKSGRTEHARERLENAITVITRMSCP